MNLVQALDFLAGNCPNVFAPISQELESLRDEKDALDTKVVEMQAVIDFLLMGGM